MKEDGEKTGSFKTLKGFKKWDKEEAEFYFYLTNMGSKNPVLNRNNCNCVR